MGVHALRLYRRARPLSPVVIYGDERHEPYDRVQLSGLLAGLHSVADIALAADGLLESPNTYFIAARVARIDRENARVEDEFGRVQPYSNLVLATGSSPHVPAIAGIGQQGVYTFRNLADAEKLAARRMHSKHTVVLGAGLLGVEAACAMRRHNTRVTLVDHNVHPLFQQLDEQSGARVAAEIDRKGVEQRLGDSIRMILGAGSVTGIVLHSGEQIECDTVVIATGISPNKSLAVDAKIAHGRGITVNASMQTSDPAIYAVGECCEIDQQVYGLVAPGFDQAAIAIDHVLGNSEARYLKPQLATSLKVAGLSVFSLGDPQPVRGVNTLLRADADSYRRVSLLGGRIHSINAVGDWPDLPRLRDLSRRGAWISPLKRLRFRFTGSFFSAANNADVRQWPGTAIVCNCNAVSCAQVRLAVEEGAQSMAALGRQTRAGTSCGSCRPLLASMIDADVTPEPVTGSAGLRGLSLVALVLCGMALLWSVDYPDTVQLKWRWDALWRDNNLKQITGYTILGLSLASLVFSLRKRWSFVSLWDFGWWRVMHVVLTTGALLAVAVHTGFRLGSNLNLYLMLTFLGLALAGALLGASIALEHRLQPAQAQRLRSIGVWGHVLLAWPLPALLGAHVWKTYYF